MGKCSPMWCKRCEKQKITKDAIHAYFIECLPNTNDDNLKKNKSPMKNS